MERAQAIRDLRRRIDALDGRIVKLLVRRLRLSRELGPLKSRLRDPRRQRAVLRGVASGARRLGGDAGSLLAVGASRGARNDDSRSYRSDEQRRRSPTASGPFQEELRMLCMRNS
ncbi:MAG: chorismate mutase [Elusimicrobia bacterium]|nr:chorismate mutase [Elusimicrobiota bacterium]